MGYCLQWCMEYCMKYCMKYCDAGVVLTTPQTWTKTTGEPFQYPLAESGAGQFSGYERVFWTVEADCTTNAPAAGDTVVSGSVAAGDGTGLTSSITLLNVKPAIRTLCYDDGSGTYTYTSGITLTVIGMKHFLVILWYIFAASCLCPFFPFLLKVWC